MALVYSWWNLYPRMVEPRKHLEAITARPLRVGFARGEEEALLRWLRG